MRDFAQDESQRAQVSGLALSETIQFRWRRRYNLAPTDPRYLDMTFSGLVQDFWAHLHVDDPKLRDRLGDDDFDATLRELGIETEEEAPPPELPILPDDSELLVQETYEPHV